MDTQTNDPSQPMESKPAEQIESKPNAEHKEHNHKSNDPNKNKLKINKYFISILILAIIATLFFYFKPISETNEIKILNETSPEQLQNISEEKERLLEIEGIKVINTVIPESLSYGNPFSFSFSLNNTKNETTNFKIKVKLDEEIVYTKDAELKANTTEDFGFTLLQKEENYPKAGEHEIIVLANDNIIYKTKFKIIEKNLVPNLEIKSFSITPTTNVKIDDLVTLNAYIRNVGSLDAKNATIKFFVDGNLLDSQTADIAQQVTIPFKTIWNPKEAHNYILKVVAEIANDPYPENNEYILNVSVSNSTT
jgi:hypothetical protein